MLPRGEFYSYAVNGVRLRDWVADIATGRNVDTVACTNCDAPGFVGQ
ncbi:MAG: hypothetical protein IPO91_23560 [Chloroflexi bacterium]|nr:hypothetical protein [Chloroflexota bacterium]